MRRHKLIFILSITLLFFIMGCQKPQTSRVSKPPKQERIKEKLEDKEADYLLKELKQKNPFRPDHAVGFAIEPEGSSGLKGIIWDSRRPFAIIGNNVVIEGDYMDNKKVIRINKDSVVLDNEGKEEILRIEESSEQ